MEKLPSPPDVVRLERTGRPELFVGLLGEVAGYLGAAVGLTAAGTVFARSSGTGTQIAFDLVTSVVLVAAGSIAATGGEGPARMRSVLFFLASFTIAGLVVTVTSDTAGLHGTTLIWAAGATISACTFVLWLFSMRSLQLIALFVAIAVMLDALVFPHLGAIVGTIVGISPQPPSFANVAMATAILGWLWFGAGLIGLLRPRTTACVLGALAAVGGPLLTGSTGGGSAGRIWSLASAIVILVVGELRGDRAIAGLGIAGTLIVASAVVGTEVTERGPAVVLLVVGVAVLGVGLALIRLSPRRPETPLRPDTEPPGATGQSS